MGVHQPTTHPIAPRHLQHQHRERLAAAVPIIVLWLVFGSTATVAISTLLPSGVVQAYATGLVHATLTVLAVLGHQHVRRALTAPQPQAPLLLVPDDARGIDTSRGSLYGSW